MRTLSLIVTLGGSIIGCGTPDNMSYDAPEDEGVNTTETDDDDVDSDDGDDGDDGDGSSDGDDDDDVTSPVDTGAPETTRDPAALGDWSVSMLSSTEVNAEIYLPQGDGPFPLVLFSPGFQLNPVDYRSYAEHLASWGYITALVNFEDSLFGGPTHNEMQLSLGEMLDWFTSDPDVLNGTADSNSVVLMGHSMGGKLSLLRASYDSRVDLIVGVDPVDAAPPFGGSDADYPSVAPERMGSITAPMLLIGEQNNATGGFACAPEGENFLSYFESATGPALEVDFRTASHMSFVDNPSCLVCLACPAGTDDPAVTKEHVRAITTAFLESEIYDEDWASDWLRGGGLAEIESSGQISTRTKNGF